MAKRGTSKQPCPGCKEMVWHETDGVCYSCRTTLERVQEVDKRIAELRSTGAVSLYRFSTVPHWNPNVYAGREFRSEHDYQTLLRNLVVAAADEVLPMGTPGDGKAKELLSVNDRSLNLGGYSRDVLAIEPRLAQAIRELDRWVRDTLPAVYDAGKAHGGKVLLALAEGTKTLADFEKELEPRKASDK